MKKALSLIIVSVMLALAQLSFAACGKDLPPSDGTPEPSPLVGRYTGDYGTLTFTGDGSFVEMDLSEEFLNETDFGPGFHEGTYVFLFHNEQWRRDKAETVRFTVGTKSAEFANAVGETGEDVVAFYLPSGAKAVFQKPVE